MVWKKRGRIYEPGQFWWGRRYGLIPTPLHLPEENKIHVYFCGTDESITGRVGFIDLSANDPGRILYSHPEPVLDRGEVGFFDDSEIAPSCALIDDGQWLLYTIGFQRCEKIGAMLFAGLAKKEAAGEKFHRVSRAPILPRVPHRPLMQGAPCVIKETNGYRMWHWYVSEWKKSPMKFHSIYNIGHAHSVDGVHWTMDEAACLSPRNEEIGIARPWVSGTDNGYEMWFSVRHLREDGAPRYVGIGHAKSEDGLHWRRDKNLCLTVSEAGEWDSEMVCYASVIRVGNRRFMFYCGNNNGETGFGWAEEIVP